ncbi:unnamed protein product [Rhizopus stolonifer]
MYKLNFSRVHSNQVIQVCNHFAHQTLAYLDSLPSIKNHLVRWSLRILYFTLGILFNWAIDAVLHQMPNMHQFPSNVAGTIVLFFLLMCAHTIFPAYTDRFVKMVDPYSTFAIKSMNIMFIPPLVQIVNNSPTPGSEVGRMMCVFLLGYFIGFIITTLLVRFFRLLLFTPFSKIILQKNTIKEETNRDSGIIQVEEAHSHVTLPSQQHMSENSALTIDMVTPEKKEQDESCKDSQNCKTQGRLLDVFSLWCSRESNFDDLFFFILFFIAAFIYLPLPFGHPAMPAFRLLLDFTMTILLFSAVSRLPRKMLVVFNPIVVASACTMAGIAYFERVKGFDIYHGVNFYKTGITFISLVEKTNVGWPGAGDVLSVTMDVSIISLAFNIYKNRPDQFRQVSG